MPCLVRKLVRDGVVPRVVDFALHGRPDAWVGVCSVCTGVVRVVEVLDYGFAGGFENVGEGDVVEPEEEVVRGCVDVFVHFVHLRRVLVVGMRRVVRGKYLGRILTRVACSWAGACKGSVSAVYSRKRKVTIPTRSIHAYGSLFNTEPLSISVVLLRDRVRAIVSVQNIRQSLDTKVSAVVLICWPRRHRDCVDSIDDA